MKQYLILILVAIAIIPVKGQLNYDRWGNIIPFSQSEKYKKEINISNIHSLKLPAYNNDSLFVIANKGKSQSQVGSHFAAGFDIDTIVDIRKNGRRFELEEGTLWIFTIESKYAKSLSPTIDYFKIPDGGYLSIISPNGADSPFTFPKKSKQDSQRCADLKRYRARILCNRAVIEYFEPKENKSEVKIVLKSISYYYAGGLKKKDRRDKIGIA